MVPMSFWGKLIAGFTMFTGLLVVAFPITILSMNMTELYEEYRAKSSVKQQVQDLKLQNILRLQDKVYGQPTILLPEQVQLLRLMLEDLIKTENHANRLESNIRHALDQISEVKIALGSFAGTHELDEEYNFVDDTDIGVSKTSKSVENDIQMSAIIHISQRDNPFSGV
eukprot:NODE_249_length_12946_cov_0.357438.p10 type:complete len:169 gc:universal NODE_249_length_12946_cov_0.357438:8368-7862(-)